ncbi:putative enoyl-CoA hydratase echA8 [Aquisphaera giovannonii]|uniref:Putative enoyl-CoA hydratase echA8 n=1 Tax=Aquisphaera giovannonii TaxID=406548 RepID=A0A5B9W6C5_9BACT|nr:enoyl-CoA hydratase-related protein [Aquisphaera giovannonii]QEH35530.1 putative enoyl-CoA hydratase echA8 [Aquisphaera giovannonii]
MSETLLLIERTRPGVAELVLNRPGRRNALTIALMDELAGAVWRLSHEADGRVLILRGAGPAFCAGLDLREASDPALAEEGAEAVRRVFNALSRTPLVTIAAAHGVAAAGGAGLLAACDFAVASEDLRIVFPEVRRGLVPALVATVLKRKLRDADLRELFLLAEPIDAARARSMGLVHRVVPGTTAREEADRLARQILRGGPQAIRSTKALLAGLNPPGDEDVRIAMEHHIRARVGEESKEGLAAFLEKREPNWA